MLSECLICKTPLPAQSGRGRPRRYCSTVCRRAAEFEIRQIDRELMRLMARRSDGLIDGTSQMIDGETERLAGRIDELRARLRELLAPGEDE